MPEGLVRTDSNKGGATFRNGQPVTLPINFGTPIVEPHQFGTTIPVSDPTLNSNPVTWQTPDPAHFGNTVAPPTQATPTFSPVAGTYATAQDVTITSVGADNIYYTTDGSTPTTGSTPYSGPVHVGSTETLKAIAVKAGLANSAVGSAAYTILGASAPTFVQQKQSFNSGGTTTATVVLDAAATAGNSVFVFVTQANFHLMGSASPTDDAGNRYALLAGPITLAGTLGGGTVTGYIYGCLNIVGAPTTISVVGLNTAAQANPMIAAVETTSAAVDDIESSIATFNTGSPVAGPSLTTSAAADLLLNYAFTADGSGAHAYSAGAGWTLLAQLGDTSFLGERIATQDQTATAAGSYASEINVASNSGSGIMAAVALKGGATPATGPSYVQSAQGTGVNNASTPTAAFGAPATTGNTVLVQVNMFDGSGTTISSVTDDAGNTYTSVLGPNNSPTDGFGTGCTRQIFACIGVVGTPQTITVHVNAMSGLITIAEIHGVTAVDATQYASTANATAQNGGSITTTGANELLVAFMAYMNGSGGRTYVPGVGWTGIAGFKETSALGEQVLLEIQQAGTAGAYTVTSTLDVAPGGGGGSQALALK